MKSSILFTPGPLNTSSTVKEAMLNDIGSRTKTLVELTKSIRENLEDIAQCGSSFSSILLQGSGTFAVEAMISSLIPSNAHVLIISNGVYGERMLQICDIYGISNTVLRQNELMSMDLNEVETELRQASNPFTHILAVQFETGIGILNDIDELTALASKYHCAVLVDAMSAFGAIPLNYNEPSLCAVAASSNKCLHGVPGIGFVVARKETLCSQKARSLSLDLYAQWKNFESNGEWRFTPPTHVLSAFHQALFEFQQMGGVDARFKKYACLNSQLIAGLAPLGICPVVSSEEYRAPMITTFFLGDKIQCAFKEMYELLLAQQLVLYPSASVSNENRQAKFRIGCMGEIDANDINNLIQAIKNISENNHEKI